MRLLRLLGSYGGYSDLFNYFLVLISSQSKEIQIYLTESILCSYSKTKQNYEFRFGDRKLEEKLLRLLRLQGFYGGYCDLLNYCVVAISSQSKTIHIYLAEFCLSS